MGQRRCCWPARTARGRHGLVPRARVVAMATAGVEPRIMGIGPAPAVAKLLARTGLKLSDVDVIELNEAFASQGIAVLRQLGVAEGRPAGEPSWWGNRTWASAWGERGRGWR